MTKCPFDEGVQVNYSMVNPPDRIVDKSAVQESRVFPYANAQECREALLKAYNKYVRGREEQTIEN